MKQQFYSDKDMTEITYTTDDGVECSVCNKEVDTVVVFSSDDGSFYLCKKCLNKSTRLIKGVV